MRLLRYLMLVISLIAVLKASALWAQEGFACAGFAVEPPVSGAAKVAVSRIRPPQGSLRILTIFAGFSDEADSHPALPSFATGLFDLERAGSLSHFYDTMSFGQLQVEGAVLPRRYGAAQRANAYINTHMDGARWVKCWRNLAVRGTSRCIRILDL